MKSCFMVHWDVAIVYIYPIYDGKFQKMAERFFETYRRFRPNIAHRLVVVSNGGPPTKRMVQTVDDLKVEWIVHDNSGWDIGGFQAAARKVSCDTMVFFSNSAYFQRPGWLERMVECSQHLGPALYGCMGNRGDLGVKVWPHIRTTGFWMNPVLFNAYPFKCTSQNQRYQFEHGQYNLSEWVRELGLKRWVVTFDGVYDYDGWDMTGNGYHRGDQSGLLSGDRLTQPPYYPPR